MSTVKTLGTLSPPAWHRPWFRYFAPVDGAEGGTPAPPVPVPTPPATPAPSAPKADEPLGAPGLSALQSERDARSTAEKELAAARLKLQEIENAGKTEQQRVDEELARKKTEIAELTVAKTRAEVAAMKGVPVALLTGTTQEEIEASAAALIAFRGVAPETPGAPTVPTEGLTPTDRGKSQLAREDLENMSPEDINKARREGRLNKLLGIS